MRVRLAGRWRSLGWRLASGGPTYSTPCEPFQWGVAEKRATLKKHKTLRLKREMGHALELSWLQVRPQMWWVLW